MPSKKLTVVILLAIGVLPGCGWFDKAGVALKQYRNGDMFASQNGVLFYGPDVLARPGQDIELVARLQKTRSLDGIHDVAVTFKQGGQYLGCAVTDMDGFARLKSKAFDQPGDVEITIQPAAAPDNVLEHHPELMNCQYELLVSVRRPDTKFIVVDMDHTIVEDGFFRVLTSLTPLPMHESAQVLHELSGTYSIVYFTQRPDILTRKSKLWLVGNRFPTGPLMTCTVRESMGDTAGVKARHLRQLCHDWPGMGIGVGDKFDDAAAYVANSMQAYLIPQISPDDAHQRHEVAEDLRELRQPKRIQAVRSWAQIRQGIVDGKRFSPAGMADELERP